MLKVAVIGLGDVSNVHLSAIEASDQAELVAVCDLDETKEESIGTKLYTDYEKMLQEEKIDCVHICLPHYLHYPVTKACVVHGVNVFLEKPLAHNLEDALQLRQLAADHPEVKICICLQNRLNETFEELMKQTADGQYGQLTGVKGLVTWNRPQSYYDVKPWRGKMSLAGGGVMINQAIHTLDLLQTIGGEVTTVRGSIEQLSNYPIEVEDTATARINFANGARGLFFATIVNSGNSSVELQAIFEKGKFTIKDSLLTVVNDAGEKVELMEDAKLPGTQFYYGASHAKLINHFYECISNHSDDYIHVEDAIPSMKMIDLIRKSSERQVELPYA